MRVLRRRWPAVRWRTNDLNKACRADTHLDWLAEAVRLALPAPRPDVIIASPPWKTLDLWLPVLLRRARKAVALHVPTDWLSNSPSARRSALAPFYAAGRALIVNCAETARLGVGTKKRHRRACWVVLFQSKAALRAMLDTQACGRVYVHAPVA